jgi:hypothetical protein
LPRNDRGWKPLPQKQDLLDDKVALRTMNRFLAQNAQGSKRNDMVRCLARRADGSTGRPETFVKA